MGSNPRLGELENQLREVLVSFEGKRARNKSIAFRVYLWATILSGGVTVLLGLQLSSLPAAYVKNLALVLSASVSVLTAVDTFFDHRSLWVRYTQTVSRLRGIDAHIRYLKSGTDRPLAEETINQLFIDLQAVLNDTNAWWQGQKAEQMKASLEQK